MVGEVEISGDAKSLPVIRDETFARFVADKVAITDLGRDIEISFLQIGMRYEARTIDSGFERFDGERVLTEVARMRMGFPEMLGFAMNFLRGGVVEGRLDGPGLRATLDEWIAQTQEGQDNNG